MILSRDLKKYEEAVRRYVKVPVNDNQFAALVSLCYNIGEHAFSRSSVVRRLNAGDVRGAADAFLMWVKISNPDGSKRTLEGLVNRRTEERKLFLSIPEEVSVIIEGEPAVVKKRTLWDTIMELFRKTLGV